ncbi:hypothetical protein O181_005059 [Austropuccinia psidii MF-1]|uniref:Retroviral polymerase SH3-like domain-containing protein n=1 Tax=Austropuccinia psidii MF-1 TaxID=1389203 RepID=A0A9Q3BGV5_9BASI|nr:hypothetical protein [Austropuccinia psidii MF-1]
MIHTVSRDKLSPSYLCNVTAPNIKSLHTFGCRVIFAVPKQQAWTFAPHGEMGIFLSYYNENSAYHILKISDRKVYTSRNVVFFENLFLELRKTSEPNLPSLKFSETPFTVEEEEELFECIEEEDMAEYPTVEERENVEIESATSSENIISSPVAKRIRVIEPRHPILINCDIREENILTYPRLPEALLT